MKTESKNASKNLLSHTSTWDEICFPVETVALEGLLPENYHVIATDRQRAIVGKKQTAVTKFLLSRARATP
jgi:predicted nucleotidyltransferase